MAKKQSPFATFLRRAAAWSVHLITASGAAWGLLALLAIQRGDDRAAMFWVAFSIVVDSVDGTLARWLDVRRYAAAIDGALLDNIVDYFTYVIVAAYWLTQRDLMPEGWALFGALVMLLTSAYQFSQVDAKTSDYYFKGFPSYWNILVASLFFLRANPWINLALVVLCGILVFVPVKYIYPSRTRFNRTLTLVLTCLFGLFSAWMIWTYPDTPAWAMYPVFAYVGYYVAASLWPKPKERRRA